ncbi:pyridine nucleotide-disulfide oxidoreductase [Citricoccus zhacaiensis]|uniref:Pyridine nucleotide-disulfide oxidoreductase n=1 Tax=Citricoccus zhacaiensis TaxID=489142 RepID=A0ABQ2LZQ5_9MICC|nr:NAD(P)/FAD-dependent oxidoreductase [Citricoccus zhacaiensis]GGO45389.1 pyridine nucleotide-disulfide oxidoreductase [Citricoccus zhacaiensis]
MSCDLPPILDALVVGGGPAGLSAATWLGRYRRSTLVVDAGHQRNLSAVRAHGLLGRDPTTPQELLGEARAGLEQYSHVSLWQGTVSTLRQIDDGLFRAVVDGTEVFAHRVVLATGVRDQVPEIAGFHDHYGTDVHHCPACDGYTARDQVVIILGTGEQLPAFAAELLDWAAGVRIITDTSGRFDDDQRAVLDGQGIEVVDGAAEALVGAPGALLGVRLAGGELVEGDRVFFSYAHHAANGLAEQLGCQLDHEGRIAVNDFQLSSVDGVYAAGDITAGLQLVPIAIGKGTAAGVACATSLRGHSTSSAAPTPAPPTRWFTAG